MRVLVSLTTVPPRFRYLARTLASIRMQSRKPDRIVVNVPRRYLRFGDFPIGDVEAAVGEGVEINLLPEDFGPGTKLIGLTYRGDLRDDDLIVCIDDDRHYHSQLVARHIEANAMDAASVKTETGWEIEQLSPFSYAKTLFPRGEPFVREGYIDCLGGCCGFSLYGKHLDAGIRDVPKESLFVDDVYFSAYFTRKAIPISVLKNGMDHPRTYAEVVAPLYWGKELERNRLNGEAVAFFRENWNIWKDRAP